MREGKGQGWPLPDNEEERRREGLRVDYPVIGPGWVKDVRRKRRDIWCPNCAHEESKSFKALRKPFKSSRKNFSNFLNEKSIILNDIKYLR
jgi:hypothetical protein